MKFTGTIALVSLAVALACLFIMLGVPVQFVFLLSLVFGLVMLATAYDLAKIHRNKNRKL